MILLWVTPIDRYYLYNLYSIRLYRQRQVLGDSVRLREIASPMYDSGILTFELTGSELQLGRIPSSTGTDSGLSKKVVDHVK